MNVWILQWSGFHSVLKVFISFLNLFCWTLTAEKKSPHEAGYDAFLCGSGKMLLKHFSKLCVGTW